MNPYRCVISILALWVLSVAFAAAAQGQPQRTFVSAQTGNDANTVNNCSVTQPCRNFAAAISVVASGGEVVALTSGGYGPVEITKAVQITAPTGVYVAITAQPDNSIGGGGGPGRAGGSDEGVVRGGIKKKLGGGVGAAFGKVGRGNI